MREALKGGKRFRPTLTLLTAQALGCELEQAMPFAVAVELVHHGTLIHDDFIDGHERRRGRRPLYKLLDPRKAFLLADMLLSAAQEMMVESRNGYRTLARAIYELCRGACSEPLNPLAFLAQLRRRTVTQAFYLSLIRLKTAELFGAACKLGAIAAEADPQLVESAYQYGIDVGMAYQLADDLADYLSICEGEAVTVPTLVKLVPFAAYFAPQALPALASLAMRGGFGRIADLARSLDLRKRCEAEIERYLAEAVGHVQPFPDSPFKPLLLEAPSFLISKLLEE